MIKILILSLLLKIITNSEILVVSNLSTVTLKNPSGQSLVVENYHTTNHPDFLGGGAQWLWLAGSSWPTNYNITVECLFTSDCSSNPGVIYITVDDSFTLYLNGVQIGTGTSWQIAYNFSVTYIYGTNNLTVMGKNVVNNSPAGIIFKVVQNQTCNSTNNSTDVVSSANQGLVLGVAVPALILTFASVAYVLLKTAPQPQPTEIDYSQNHNEVVDESVQNFETMQPIIHVTEMK